MPAAASRKGLLTDLLKQVSRSFYLTLWFLPRSVRRQISLAYLLARTTDTIADTEIVSVDQRLAALQQLRECILGTSSAPLNFGALAQQQGLPAERVLLERVEDSLSLLAELSPADQQSVRAVLEVITSGQELDLQRFADASAGKIVALQNDAELDDYTYRVAGCVGKFWTEMCLRHGFRPEAAGADALARFEAEGVQFGKGLQLVNILRDLPVDLRKGRCYLPQDQLAAVGLTPADLLDPANAAKLQPLYHRYLALAETYLTAGWHYTLTIGWPHFGMRLACALPILFGIKTIARLRAENVLDAGQRVKISRTEVRGLVSRLILYYPFRSAWKRLGPGGG